MADDLLANATVLRHERRTPAPPMGVPGREVVPGGDFDAQPGPTPRGLLYDVSAAERARLDAVSIDARRGLVIYVRVLPPRHAIAPTDLVRLAADGDAHPTWHEVVDARRVAGPPGSELSNWALLLRPYAGGQA